MDLQDSFDTIVVGTGLVESILAAALARAGQKVLHLDQNQFYGSDWTTLTPLEFRAWNKSTNTPNEPTPTHTTSTNRSQPYAPFVCSSLWSFQDEHHCNNKSLSSTEKNSAGKDTTEHNNNNTASTTEKRRPKFSHDSIGALVETSFGLGVISGCHRSTGMFVVELDWVLSNGKAATMSLLPALVHLVGTGTIIQTSYGRGAIEKVHQPMTHINYSEYCQIQSQSQSQNQSPNNAMVEDMYQVQLEQWTLANSQHPVLFVRPSQILKSSSLSKQHQRYRKRQRNRGPPPTTPLEHIIHDSRRYQLDLSPQLLLSGGVAVDVLVRSGVHEYVEFLPLDDMFVAAASNDGTGTSSFTIQHVPCSKADVFKTTTLSMLDKRILMKFLRFVMDINTNNGNVLNKNEKSLGKGRSLTRPQNAPTLAYPDYEEYMDQPLSTFYQRCQMSDKLQSIVTHAIGYVSVLPSEIKTSEGLRMVSNVLSSLGKFSKSPFLCTKYGNSELPQAFCRLCAVYGGVYMLRVGLLSFVVGEEDGKEKDSGEAGEAGEEKTVEGKNKEEKDQEYVTGILLEDPDHSNDSHPNDGDGSSIKTIAVKSKHVFVAPEYVEQLTNGMHSAQSMEHKPTDPVLVPGVVTVSHEIVCRCILITNQSVPHIDVEKCVVVIPPNSMQHQHRTIHVLQLSGSQVSIAPNDKYVVHLTTTVQLSASTDGDVPHSTATATVAVAAAAAAMQGETTLRQAVTQLYGGASCTNHGTKHTTTTTTPIAVLEDRVEWSGYFHDAAAVAAAMSLERKAPNKPRLLPKNVYCRRRIRTTAGGAPIDVDAAFYEAQRLFEIACPNETFLPARVDPSKASTTKGEGKEDEDEESDMSGLDSDDDYGV